MFSSSASHVLTNLPTSLSASGVSATFSYGPDRQRKQQTAVYNANGTSGTETTIYIAGLMEKETTPAQTHYKHFVTVPGGTQIIYDLHHSLHQSAAIVNPSFAARGGSVHSPGFSRKAR